MSEHPHDAGSPDSDYGAEYYIGNRNNYRDRFEFVLANAWRAAYVLAAFRPRTVLDVGGGMGLLVERLRRWGVDASGVEISHYAICQAPDPTKRCFVQGSMTRLPFADKSFDVVASVNVLEHMQPEEVEPALQECARVARFGQYQEITVLEDVTVVHRDPTHHTKMTARQWLDSMSEWLPGWRAKRGLHLPVYKNGIFLLRADRGR